MERSRLECIEAGARGEGEGPVQGESVGGTADPDFVIAGGLTAEDDDEYTQEYEELCLNAENVNSVAALELYIHQCHQRIGEFDQALKHRDSAIIRLGETLSGILCTVKKAHEDGQSAEDYVEALKTRVSSATEFLSNIYQVKDEDGDDFLDEQDRSLTEICESSALHSFTERSHASLENGAIKEECTHYCKHLKEITEIKEQVLHSLAFLQVPADIIMKQRDLELAGNIQELSSQAYKYKCAHEGAHTQLQSTKEESESLKSEVLSKEEALSKLKAQINELNVELKVMKDRCNTLEQDYKCRTSGFEGSEMDQEKTRFEDKWVQSFIDLNMMDRLLEIFPSDVSNLSNSCDMFSDSNVVRTEGEKSVVVPVNVNSSSLNDAKISTELAKVVGLESETHGIFSNSNGGNGDVSVENSSLTLSKIKKNVSNEVKVDLDISVACEAVVDNEGSGMVEKMSTCKSDHLELGALLLDTSSVEELLLDLGAKARELSVIKNQLKIMKDREESLRSQLNCAMDSCAKVEKRCKNAEKLAIDLQSDLESLFSERGTLEINKSGSLVDVLKNNEKEMSFIKSYSLSQENEENQRDNILKDTKGSSTKMEEFIPSFLHKFWNKMQLTFDVIVKMNEEKTDLFFPKKIAPMRASLENDICQLAVYLKRKDEVIMQAKMLLEGEYYLQKLKTQVVGPFSASSSRSLSELEEKENDANALKWINIKNCSSEDIVSSWSRVCEEMDAINTQVIKCLMYCMEQEHEKQTTELKMHHANDVSSLKQLHALQLKNLMEEVCEKMAENHGKTEETIMSKSSICWEVEPADIEIKDSYKEELEAVWVDVDKKHREALKQIFKRISVEQISLATKTYKESYDLKVNEEITLLKSVHQQELEALKSALEHEKHLEVLNIRQEISKSSKDYVNEMIKAVESGLKGLQSRCYDIAIKASLANATALDDLKKKIIREFQLALKGLGEAWLKKLERDANAEEENDAEGNPVSGVQKRSKLDSEGVNNEHQLHSQNPFVYLRSTLISMSEGHIKEIAEGQFECMKELMEKLQSEQSRFKLKLLEVHWNNGSNLVPAEGSDQPMEKKSETYSMNPNIYSLLGAGDEAWINDIKSLKKELDGKHAKEMESLRLYFEKKCAEVEKRYSEDVLTQRSQKCSATGSSNGSSNTSIVGSAAELESDHFFLNSEDAVPSRNLEEHEGESLDMHLMVSQGMSYDERRIELEAKIREELHCQMAEENEKKLAEIIKDLRAEHEEALRMKISAEAKAYSMHIEEVTNAIKKCSEEEQEKFIRSHREMMDKFLEQHQKDLIDLNELHDQELQALQQRDMSGEVGELRAEIEKIHLKYNQELIEVSQKLMQEHGKEVSELKANLKRQHEEEIETLVQEIKRKEEYCEEVKRQCEAKLEELKENFDAKLQEKVEQSRLTIIGNLNGQNQALFGDGDGKDAPSSLELCTLREHLKLKDSELTAVKNKGKGPEEDRTEDSLMGVKKTMNNQSEFTNPVLLEQQVDFLKHGIESDFNDRFSRSECMGRDLVTLKLQVNQLEQSKNILLSRFGEAEVEIDNATSVTVLQTDLDKLLKDRDKWKKATHILRILLKDILEYTHSCENELNDTIVQSMLRLSGVCDSSGLSEESENGVVQPRRVHIAPERLPNILNVDEVEDGEQGEDVIPWLEDSGEGIRIELKQCLARLRAEASALLGLSTIFRHSDFINAFDGNIHSQQELIDKISLLEDYLKKEVMEKDKLKVELHTAKGLCEGHASTIASLLARATQAEGQLTTMLKTRGRLETVAEGYGEGSGMTHFSGQFQKMAKFGEKARMMLKEYQHQGGSSSSNQEGLSGTLIAQLVEELCVEGDRLSEEARKEREDLQLQVEAADKQLRSTRAFLEEQAVEREQEREEFQRELHCLHEALGGREREKVDRERIVKEDIPRLNQKEGQDPSSRDTVERLELQSKDLTQLLQETTAKKEELEVELKAAVDKIWDLREIIRELEGQVEGNLLLEKDLRSKNERLAADMVLQSKKLNDLIEELESLRSSLGYSIPGEMENQGHTALLEEALRKHCLQVEQAKSLGPSLKDLTCKLLDMGQLIDKKTKEIEAMQVTPATCGNCSSPSEDVSIREQLEQATWRSESPVEDEVSELGTHMGGEEGSGLSRSSLSLSIPRVPLSEFVSLQEKFSRHCQAQEPLRKRIHDLEMQLHSLRKNEEELMTEREVLQSQVEQQLLHNSELQARLDEARQRGGRQVHCVTVTPLPSSPMTRSPIGSPSATPDQPFFCCAALAEARHEIENITECLEKKELELTQLKGALENSKKVVALQEKELTNKAVEDAQTFEKLREFERLKSEKNELQIKLSNRIKTDDGAVPFSILLDALLAEKNEEIDFLSLQVATLKEQLLLKAKGESKIFAHKEVQHSKESAEDFESKSHHSTSDSTFGEEIEVLRECAAPELSIERLDVIHSGELDKQWCHSTKLEVHTSADSPGLTASPVTPCIRNVHEVILNSISEEEIPETPAFKSLSSKGHSISRDVGAVLEGNTSVLLVEAETQTSGEMEKSDWEKIIQKKEEEIEAFQIKVNKLSLENSGLREKINWHSQHLEKHLEECTARDSQLNHVKTEKESLKNDLIKYEQEISNLKISRSDLQEEVIRLKEQVNLLNGKIEKYCRANKDQHMLLKAVQQERKEVQYVIDALSLESQRTTEHYATSSPLNSPGKQNSSDGRDSDASQRKLLSPTVAKTSIREAVYKLVEEVKYLRSELNYVTSQRDSMKQEFIKALDIQESLRAKLNAVPASGELGTFSDPDERGPSPLEHGALEQMMEKVQLEGIEVLSLSEIAASRKSTSGDATPALLPTPLGSPLPQEEKPSGEPGVCGSLSTQQKTTSEVNHEKERMRLLLRIQELEDELACKEREETRKRDWLEFQEKEGHAGWTGVVEAVGQKQRHELDILERLGEQRNARARLEAELTQLNQQLNQAEADTRKAVYRLGMERSHFIRLESALKQEKANFSQLQVSLDTERKRSNMTKELNSRVIKALQDELAQYQAKFSQLQVSFKQEHDIRKELEVQLNQLQIELGYAAGATEEQRVRLGVMMSEERMKLKKIEEDCERKALEQELEEEKEKRMKYQQEVVQLRSLLDARPNQDYGMGVDNSRWAATTSPSTAHASETAFNAEDMLQDLKGVNQILGWHVRNKDDYPNPALVSIETEKNFLDAKCCHLEQKLVALQDMLTRERSLWANERAVLLRDQQYLYESIPHHTTPKEIHKFQEVFQKLYSHYWRSERNRKALAWQKRYFLSLLENYKAFKHQTIGELSKVTGEQRNIIDQVSGRSKRSSGTTSDPQTSKHRSRGKKSFRVVVWSVIATLKMKVLVLRSMTGIRIGSQSLLEEVLQPAHPHNNAHHSLYQQQTHLTLPYTSGASDMGSEHNLHSLSPVVSCRKSNSIGEIRYQHNP